MRGRTYKSWREFRDSINSYAGLTAERRSQLIFRGHASSSWPLQTTLDRQMTFDSNEHRELTIDGLIHEFRMGSYGLSERLPTGTRDWELLGRHHGLAMPILDWTQSPYIASFFAFDDEHVRDADSVAIWVLDLDVFRKLDMQSIVILEPNDEIRHNLRAIEQRGVFLRIGNVDKTVEEQLSGALYCMKIPHSDRQHALADLYEMNVSARSLFRDLDGAARTANRRILVKE